MKGLILAGGHGTRLRPLTFSGNKHMIPIANEPMLFHGLRHFAQAGITDVGVVLGTIHEGIREAVGDGTQFGLRVRYIHQGDPRGLADAVLCAWDYLGDDPFVMYLGDNLIQQGVRPFVDLFNKDAVDAVIGVTPVAHPSQYGVVELDGGRIVSIEEKPAAPRSDLALIGVYLFSPAIHPVIERLQPSRRGELEITDAIRGLHESRRRVVVQPVSGWWKDTGRPEDLLEANDLVLRTSPSDFFENLGEVASSAQLAGPVRLGRGAYVGEGSRVEGPAVIGEGAHVEEHAEVGAGTAIGDRAKVVRARVRRSVVMEGALLEGPLDISDSIVGRGAQITRAGSGRMPVKCIVGDATQVRI